MFTELEVKSSKCLDNCSSVQRDLGFSSYLIVYPEFIACLASLVLLKTIQDFYLSVPNGSLLCQHLSLLCKNILNLTPFLEQTKQCIQMLGLFFIKREKERGREGGTERETEESEGGGGAEGKR